MEEEVWLPIIGYEGLYEISSYGRVKALPKVQIMPGIRNHGIKKSPEKILKIQTLNNKTGHLYIDLVINNKAIKQLIHRLVAFHFIPNPNNYPQVRHQDDNPTNNHYNNLLWGTVKMNMNDKLERGRQPFGENVHNSILTTDQVIKIKTDYNKKTNGCSILGKQYGVDEQTIRDIIKEKTWKHIKI